MQLKKNKIQEKKYNPNSESILTALLYLSNEANRSGLNDLCAWIKTIIELYPEMRDQNMFDPETDLNKIIQMFVKFKMAPPDVKMDFISLMKNISQSED